jgi:hypothetical protein
MFRALIKMTKSRAAAAGLATLCATFACVASAAAEEPPAAITSNEAAAALDTAQATIAPQSAPADAEPAADATIALRDLAAAYPELGPAGRRRADSLLARPTDGSGDPLGDGFPAAAPVASAESPHFCVFWVNSPGFPDAPSLTDANGVADGDGTPDYVESLLQIAEYSYSVEVAPGALGWEPPKPDKEGCGASPSTHSDLYLKQLGKQGLFGYQTVDPGQGRARSQYGYMVLDNDYAKSEYGYDDPAIPASVTFAHEFNHLLQVNYDTFQDTWMLEATAVWTEEKVYPDVNDYLGYISAFAKFPGEPMTSTFPPSEQKSLRIYGAAVWNHWLDTGGGGYGSDAIRRAWELSDVVNPADFALSAYDRSIEKSGGKGFSREFVPFAATTAEWRSGAGNFPDHASYPDMKRKGSLAKGGEKSFALDHTAYRLLNVQPSGGGKLKLSAEVDKGVRAGLALVARDGDELSGAVTKKVRFLDKGGSGSVTLSDPGRFERITAVLINADDAVKGFSGGDWVYSGDDTGFSARLSG